MYIGSYINYIKRYATNSKPLLCAKDTHMPQLELKVIPFYLS